MIEYVRLVVSKYNEFQGGGAQMAMFWLAALALFVGNTKEQNKIVATLLRYTALFVLIFLCPVSAGFIMKYCIGENVYWRMLWLLPEVVLLAYLLTKWILQLQGWRRIVALLLTTVLLVATGTGYWTYVKPDMATGITKLPRGVPEICQALQADGQQRKEEVRVLVTDELICSIRQFDATIKMPYGRAVLKGEREHILHDVIAQQPFSPELLAHWAKQYQCNYLVYPLSEDGTLEEQLAQAGYEAIGQVEGYQLYYLDVNNKDGWKLIQYPDDSGQQGVFYTLYNQKTGKLILVDGGWKENADKVRRVINAYGGTVNVWFITHYDNDHVDAFNEIYAQKRGIRIKRVYVTPLDYDYYMDNLREWDTPESFTTFRELTENDKNVKALKRGRVRDVCGLQLQVFNSYDDKVAEINQKENDVPNLASLVFKLSAEEHSVLFCGDCHGKAMARLLLDQYGSQMQADYVQVGHHGNNSFPESFYSRIQPEVAMFDAPAWLMEGDKYTAAELKNYFCEQGITTLDYTTGMHILDMD